jgi:pyrimidine operon attenuation protein/uracil phosphoribosyltransferase
MPSALLLDGPAVARTLSRMAGEIVERTGSAEGLVVAGIQRRGVELANRLARLIEESTGKPVTLGKLDITLYRDDLSAIGPRPRVGATELSDEIEDRVVVLVVDVLYTGRTIRAALDELADFGRPRRILLAVLIDRGGRELPIQADVVGQTVETGAGDRVEVAVSELDGHDGVEVVRGDRP